MCPCSAKFTDTAGCYQRSEAATRAPAPTEYLALTALLPGTLRAPDVFPDSSNSRTPDAKSGYVTLEDTVVLQFQEVQTLLRPLTSEQCSVPVVPISDHKEQSTTDTS